MMKMTVKMEDAGDRDQGKKTSRELKTSKIRRNDQIVIEPILELSIVRSGNNASPQSTGIILLKMGKKG